MSQRLAALLLPVFSLRREGGLGIGDTRSMHEWIDLAADHGVGLFQMLPINEMGADDSPYNAISSVALEPLYLCFEEVPGVTDEMLDEVRKAVSSLPLNRVDYESVKRVKYGLLAAAWDRWGNEAGPSADEFAKFCKAERAWLDNYCVYRWLMEQEGGNEAWDEWPESWQSVEGAMAVLAEARANDPAKVESRISFFAWVQWLCFRQWRAVREHADRRGLKLMGDIPIGVSRYSADVFFGRDDFNIEWCGGAPPETVFKHDRFIQKWGQNWGIPLYRWDKMEAEGFPWWRQRIEKLIDVFHVFRVDHVLGFYRIYGFPWTPNRNAEFLDLTKEEAAELTGGPLPRWVPRPDDTEENCELNRADGDRRLRMVQKVAGKDAVVGEDLGCVPDYVRPHLYSLGICGFRIPHWDFDDDGKVIPAEELPETSFATYATHDHDSIPAMWEDYRRRVSSDPDDEDDRKETMVALQALADFGGIEDLGPFDEEKLWRLIDRLMECSSRYAAVMLTDLFNMTDRINQPGTVGPHNWSLMLERTAEQCRKDPAWKRLEESIRNGKRLP